MRLYAMYQSKKGKRDGGFWDLAEYTIFAALVFFILLIICTYISARHVTAVTKLCPRKVNLRSVFGVTTEITYGVERA
ncbi:hypothetical protein J3R82DRAFT_9164 [Butyriboletus roseoflavus]|nr:hypothetical protein J3R82DRAFT_9164 [Butyriboletus roseoflavus]